MVRRLLRTDLMKADRDLKQDVITELRWEPSVNETHIGVSVKDGVVTLSGHVPSYGEKYGAEKAAKRVAGVAAVANELDVRLPSDTSMTDEDVANRCLAALRAHSEVPADKIKVVVTNGWVTLEGMVDWEYQRKAAEGATRYLLGVRGITSSIALNHRASASDIKDKIEAAFKRSADIDSNRIHVETRAGTVILRGEVHSWNERNEAQRAAWAAPGVLEVKNELVVVA